MSPSVRTLYWLKFGVILGDSMFKTHLHPWVAYGCVFHVNLCLLVLLDGYTQIRASRMTNPQL